MATGRLPIIGGVSAPPERPLVGRGAEWSALLANWAEARDGRLVVIEGEAGIGKTRLAESFMEYARQCGARTALARCYEGELNLAYGPFVEGLRGVLGASGEPPSWLARLAPHALAEVARLLPELLAMRPDLPAAAALDGPGAPSRFFDSLRQMLLGALGPANSSGRRACC